MAMRIGIMVATAGLWLACSSDGGGSSRSASAASDTSGAAQGTSASTDGMDDTPAGQAGTTAGQTDTAAGQTDRAAQGTGTVQVGGESCGFDPENEGKKIGRAIKNFGLKTVDQTPYWLHSNCGTPTRAVWLVLGTGWCGACETYAPMVEPIWQEYKDQGLEIMWIVGEDENGNPPTWPWLEHFVQDKGVTFTVLRDSKFLQVYGAIDPHSTALPHQYVIDAQTMELKYATGGVAENNQGVMDTLSALLGVPVQP